MILSNIYCHIQCIQAFCVICQGRQSEENVKLRFEDPIIIFLVCIWVLL